MQKYVDEIQDKYAVYVHWCNDVAECHIYHPTKDELKSNGDNYVSRGGSEGMHYDIYDDLETALVAANFEPDAIDFSYLTNEDVMKKNEILKKYKWDAVKGLVKSLN